MSGKLLVFLIVVAVAIAFAIGVVIATLGPDGSFSPENSFLHALAALR